MQIQCSTAKDKLDIRTIHEYISKQSYWGKGRTLDEVKQSIDSSLCFGMYDPSNTQVGFARVVTDSVVFAYLMDVIIFEPYQRQGYGKQLMSAVLTHQQIKDVQSIVLKTRDAHGLYEQFGFKSIGNSALWMSREKKK